MCRRTRCWRSGRDRVAIEELPRRRRAARRRSSSCRGCQAFVGEPLPPWPQLSLMVVPRERAGPNDGVPASRAEHMARCSDHRGQGPRPGPVPRAPRGLLHPGALDGRGGRERVLSGRKIIDAGCSSCAPGCCPARRSPSGRVGSRPPGPDQGARARAPTRPAPSALCPAPLRAAGTWTGAGSCSAPAPCSAPPSGWAQA